MYSDWEAVIGLEIHAQLSTSSKIFSSDSAEFTHGDNRHISPVSLGMPGTLPVLNKEVVHLGIRTGLALNCEINKVSFFERKNYFYPDLAKGYQISQFQMPICGPGKVEFSLNGKGMSVALERAHLEEDAGKSTHTNNGTLVNYNRAGVALLEIVSGPDMRSPAEAAAYSRAVRQILRYAQVCDGNLEEGSMRCDCNVSVRKKGDLKLGVRVELKNINSFRFIEKALEYEIHRQVDVIESGGKIVQETRLYDSTKNKTFTMRSKEEAEDYRYFPDPDLLPIVLTDSEIDTISKELPEMPTQKKKRFISEYGLSLEDAEVLTEEVGIASYFEKAVNSCKIPALVANWIKTELFRELNQSKINIEKIPVQPEQLAKLLVLLEANEVSSNIAKKVFQIMWEDGGDPQQIIVNRGWKQVSNDNQIEQWVEEVIRNNPNQVEEYKSGKSKVISFLMGQVMKTSKGQANPKVVQKMLVEKMR